MPAQTRPTRDNLLGVHTVRRAVWLLVVGFVVHTLVIPQLAGARRSLAVVGSINPWLMILVVLLEAAALGVYAELTRKLAAPRNQISFRTAGMSVLASTAVNHVVPGGAATTAAVSYRILGRAGVPRTDLGFVLGVQAVGSAVVLNVLLWMALLVSIPIGDFHPVYATSAAVGAALITLIGGAVIGLLRGREGIARAVAGVAGRLPLLDEARVRAGIELVADRLSGLLADRRRLAIATGLAAANWLFDAAALWTALAAFGHRPDPIGVLVAYGLANVVAAVPVSPGGLGVIEAILIPTLVAFGTPSAEASVAVVAYRLVSFWLPIPVGVAAYGLAGRLADGPEHRRFREEIEEQLDHGVAHRPEGA